MVYAYDLWALLPVKDIYDTQMMLAHIGAAKDMYEKAALEMKDFKKEYGDFYSSRPGDMDWYKNEYGKIKQTMDDLYARGIDPLRSLEGRTAMARARDSFNIAEYALRKKSAANYDIYLQNKAKLDAAGKFNPLMEDLIIQQLGLNDPNKPWDRLSPSIYQDPIEITDNIFSKMEDDFMGTDKNGLDWYGVSRQRRQQALDAAIGDILNTPSGKFHYDQYRAANPSLSESVALEGFKNQLLNESIKYERRKSVENPIVKRELDFLKSVALENLRHLHALKEKENPQQDVQLNWTQQQVLNVKAKLANGVSEKTLKTAEEAFRKASSNSRKSKSEDGSVFKAAISYMSALRQHVSAPINNNNFGMLAFLGESGTKQVIPLTAEQGIPVLFNGSNRFNLEGDRLSKSTNVLRFTGSSASLNGLINNSGLRGYIINKTMHTNVFKDGTVDVVVPVSFRKRDIVSLIGRDLTNDEKRLLNITTTTLHPGVRRPKSSTKDERLYDEEDWYNIPMSRTIDNNGGLTRGEIDTMYDKLQVGATEASGNRLINQAKSAAGI